MADSQYQFHQCSPISLFACWVILHAFFILSAFFIFSKNFHSFRNTIRVSKYVDPDQVHHFVSTNLTVVIRITMAIWFVLRRYIFILIFISVLLSAHVTLWMFKGVLGSRKFCQWGSNFDNVLMRGGRIQIPLKAGHYWPAS